MAITIFYTISDGSIPAHVSKMEFPLHASTSFDNAVAAVEAIWNLVNPLTSGRLVSAGFSVEADIAGFTNPVAQVLADIQERAHFVFRTVNGFLKRFGVPEVAESIFGSGGAADTVDTANPDVAAFVAAMETGVNILPAGLVTVTDRRGENLEVLESAVEAWGKTRR